MTNLSYLIAGIIMASLGWAMLAARHVQRERDTIARLQSDLRTARKSWGTSMRLLGIAQRENAAMKTRELIREGAADRWPA